MRRESQNRIPKTGMKKNGGIQVSRFFTDGKTDPFDTVKWVIREAKVVSESGQEVFHQENVEFPEFYSQTAINVIASKYFRGQQGTTTRENSMRTLIRRVVETITGWGKKQGYFKDQESADAFRDEITYMVLHQIGTFNSPVWFNVGVEEKPQCSACFINAIEDTMESILNLVKIEGMLFKFGSGTGTNFSTLRSSRENLSGGGKPSGPVSFMKGFDAFAGAIKSGGKTRRAAKMVILNIDHPDIVDFIEAKAKEEAKAQILIKAGYDPSFDGEAYASVSFQNANHSVRVTDEFMKAVEEDREWVTREVCTKKVVDRYKARDLWDKIATCAHLCGDPGLQFDTTINEWNTCANSGRINASNPCSEFMFLDNSACNLASLNLTKFLTNNGEFDLSAFSHAVRLFILAQEIIVSNASYPTKEIEENSESFRPLGLGYANLGALLMRMGLPYDSDQGRAVASAITAIMTGVAYAQSAKMAKAMGHFQRYHENKDCMLKVIKKHISYLDSIPSSFTGKLKKYAKEVWKEAYTLGEKYGFRNAQVTLLAPTGTIGFMMDCDTTGIEPDIALVKYKRLVGGGTIKIVNQSVSIALERLGYDPDKIKKIIKHIEKEETIEGAEELSQEHLPVFDCAFKPAKGKRFISVDGHLKMMAQVQPFLSGAISKTVNMPNHATIDDVKDTFMKAWKLGLKAISIYRDGSKTYQPVVTSSKPPIITPHRRRLPDERKSITHKFSIAGHEGYITVGMYDDGSPGEIFIVMAKQGSVISGLMDAFATAISIALQYGVPLKVLVDKFAHVRFEPSGYSSNPAIGYAKSIIDYIFRYLALKFLPPEERPINGSPDLEEGDGNLAKQSDLFQNQEDAPPCQSCGFIMVRSGSCYRCLNCGSTSGCS